MRLSKVMGMYLLSHIHSLRFSSLDVWKVGCEWNLRNCPIQLFIDPWILACCVQHLRRESFVLEESTIDLISTFGTTIVAEKDILATVHHFILDIGQSFW